jgi:hypothetical protein
MRTFIAFAFCLLISAGVVAQERTAEGGARKIDSFGEILDTDWLARLDNFAIELQNSPGSKGYVAAFYARHKLPGLALRLANRAVNYLIMSRDVAPERLSVINSGFADETRFELWAAEGGAQPPVKAFDPALMMAGEKNPLLFDRLVFYEPSDYGLDYGNYSSLKGTYEPFATVLDADRGLRACIIGYMKKGNRRGTDRRLAERAKRQLATAHAVDVSRVVAIGGGRRGEKMVEMWLVPPGSDLPRPTPAAGRRRTRR